MALSIRLGEPGVSQDGHAHPASPSKSQHRLYEGRLAGLNHKSLVVIGKFMDYNSGHWRAAWPPSGVFVDSRPPGGRVSRSPVRTYDSGRTVVLFPLFSIHSQLLISGRRATDV